MPMLCWKKNSSKKSKRPFLLLEVLIAFALIVLAIFPLIAPPRWDVEEAIKNSPLVKDPNALIKDGWGQEFDVVVEDGVIKVSSEKLDEYKKTSKSNF